MTNAKDLFQNTPVAKVKDDYDAHSIEVLEGLEPVRRRPGMYIGGTDERAFHHLAAEIIDNSMDEAVAGHASYIEVKLDKDNILTVKDNGRGIPVDPHPKFPDKSALEVIFTTLHAGGKFDGKAYQTSGGLHGVGSSVVNALSEFLIVEVAKNRELFRQTYERGTPKTPIEKIGAVQNRRGTVVTFKPDADIFGKSAHFKPARLYRMIRSKAYLYKGVEIIWKCDPDLINDGDVTPVEDKLHFPNGILDFLKYQTGNRNLIVDNFFSGEVEFTDTIGKVEWAIAWFDGGDSSISTYCNTIPTPLGGTHEQGLRAALSKGLRNYANLKNNKKAGIITPDDVMGICGAMLSLFMRDPEFQGQTKEKLSSSSASNLVEKAVRDRFEHWLTSDTNAADSLLDYAIDRAEIRLKAKQDKDVSRASATKKLRLPGKLADCSNQNADGTELFLVEGDSAGGSAKQARDRKTQAILPLRGKILNVASATNDKMKANQELSDLLLAIGCGTGAKYREQDLRYERIIIMTDADVDGAHIASLLMTFFYREIPKMIEQGHLFLAVPPLYRLSHGGKTYYARDDADKARILNTILKNKKNIELGRFKGLGEMMPKQLKETTMAYESRQLIRLKISDFEGETDTNELVEQLMGRKAEARYDYITRNAAFVVDELDV